MTATREENVTTAIREMAQAAEWKVHQARFGLPVLDDEEGAWTIYDAKEIQLCEGFYTFCEMEVWEGENQTAEILCKLDSEMDLRTFITGETERRIVAHLKDLGISATSAGWRESGAQEADMIILLVNLGETA